MKRFRLHVFYYGPLAAWMAVIFLFSTGIGESENSKDLIVRILQAIDPERLRTFTPDQLSLLNYLLRKAGHLTEYFILMALAVRAFQYGRERLRIHSPIAALALCGIYAASDEYHQYFVSGRSATMVDALIDISGALGGMAVILGWFLAKHIEREIWKSESSESAADEHSVQVAEQGVG